MEIDISHRTDRSFLRFLGEILLISRKRFLAREALCRCQQANAISDLTKYPVSAHKISKKLTTFWKKTRFFTNLLVRCRRLLGGSERALGKKMKRHQNQDDRVLSAHTEQAASARRRSPHPRVLHEHDVSGFRRRYTRESSSPDLFRPSPPPEFSLS